MVERATHSGDDATQRFGEALMSDAQQEAPRYTAEQLHGRACIVCHLEVLPLMPCGHVYTGEGGTYGWSAVACPAHLDQAFLDLQHWVVGPCAIGAAGHQAEDALVVEIDHVEQGTLTGHPIYSCRSCLEYRLRLDRAWADGDPEYRPQLRRPRLADGESTGLRDVAPILRRDGARRTRALRGGC